MIGAGEAVGPIRGKGQAMLATLKIIHLMCLAGGGAATIGNAVLMRCTMAGGGPPPPVVVRAMGILGKVGLASIVLIWITGIALTMRGYGGGEGLGWEFYVKLAGATLVLGAVAVMSILGARAERAGALADPARMKPLSMLVLAGTIVAVVFAVITFA